jgi:glycosyltransferase involved in cell wall biosynthesis
MISLAVTIYNRSTIDSFIKVLNNKLISEIVIVDDFSNPQVFLELKLLVKGIKKVKLYRNNRNLGPLLNKREAISKCTNDWVILLDSDNIIDNSYIDKVAGIDKQEDVLYSPQILYVSEEMVKSRWNYKDFTGLIIDENNVKDYLSKKDFTTLLNTGNYFINRNRYLSVMDQRINETLGINDALYFAYLWLYAGNKIMVVSDLGYVHNVNPDSWYINNYHKCMGVTFEIVEKIKQL